MDITLINAKKLKATYLKTLIIQQIDQRKLVNFTKRYIICLYVCILKMLLFEII